MKRLVVLSALIAAAVFPGSVHAEEPAPKEVKCSIEIMPNYLWHLFALSNLWDREKSPYLEKYGHTVPSKDREYIHEHRALLVWGNGVTGKFTGPLFFAPFREELSPEEYFRHLDEADTALRNDETGTVSAEEAGVFSELKRIILDNFPAYRDGVWAETRAVLEKDRAAIDSYFAGSGIIEKWEDALRMPYRDTGFYPVLTYANAVDALTTANNLSSSRNNFGVLGLRTEITIDLIIHEIGIFTMMPLVAAIWNDEVYRSDEYRKNNIVYQALESFIEVKKNAISGSSTEWQGEMQTGGRLDFPWFFDFYRANEGKSDAETLIRSAITEYARSKR